MSDNNNTDAVAGRREWIGLLILSIACLLYSMDLSVLFLAIPAITADLAPSATELLWINDIYGFMVAGFLVTMGTLGDRIGRRKVLLIGAAFFAAASVFAAFAQTAEMLILARALLGIAGATIAPSTLSLVVNLFRNEAERNRAISIWGTAFAIGGLVGPLVGGVLLEYFHWGSVFLINVPIMALLLVTAPFLLPEYKNEDGGRIDFLSVGLSLATVLPVIYGFKKMAADGFAFYQLLPVAAGLALGFAFIARQKVITHPLIDLALFKVPAFTVSLLINLSGVFFLFGIFLFQNQFLQLVLGLSPLEAALWSIPPSLVFTVMSFQAYRVTNRYGPVRTVLLGLVTTAAGTFVMGISAYAENIYGVLAGSMIMGVGFVPTILTTTGLIVGSAPPERAGSASAMSETSAEFGGALGVAVLGSIGTLIYRAVMTGIDMAGLDSAQVLASASTLAGAVEAAKALGTNADPAWLTTARDGYSLGFAAICIMASVSLVLIAALARRSLREPTGQPTLH